MDKIIAFISLILVLMLVNISILKKEDHLANGKVVYLRLAPVDPRSLMQGDYMALQFEISNNINSLLYPYNYYSQMEYDENKNDGYIIVKLDEKNIATFQGLYTNQKLSNDELLMRYRFRNYEVKFATNAFFFQEGTAEYYEKARYGEFRVDDKGELLLVGMYDENLIKLGPLKDELELKDQKQRKAIYD
jgi:uncharacterized membrane-anchored protein